MADALKRRGWSPEVVIGAAACIVALLMLGYRFANLGLAPFINDEPMELDLARQYLKSGEWPSHNPLSGSQGVHYGAATLWLDQVVQLVGGPAPETAIFTDCLLMTLAHLALCLALARTFKLGLIGFAMLLAWVASSPYQFFWSRLAWDPVNTCVLLSLAVVIGARELTWRTGLLLGLALGVGLSIHLLLIPLTGLVFVVLAAEKRREPLALLKGLGALAVTITIVCIPYLTYALRQERLQTPPTAFQPSILEGNVLNALRLGTWSGVDYYFDHEWPQFRAWLGGAAPVLSVLSVLTVGAGALCIGFGLYRALRSAEPPARRAGLLGLAVLLVYPAFYTWRNLELHPHYQYVTWWVVPMGIAAIIGWLQARSANGARVAMSAVALIAVAQFAFIVAWMSFIRERGGTSGIHYATPISLQREAIKTACNVAAPSVYIRNETQLFDHGLQYVASVEPACTGKQVTVGRGMPSTGAVVRLRYVSPAGGAITIQ